MHLKEEEGARRLHAGGWKTIEAALGSCIDWWDPGDLGPSSGTITCWLCDLWDSLYLPVHGGRNLQLTNLFCGLEVLERMHSSPQHLVKLTNTRIHLFNIYLGSNSHVLLL